MLHFIKCFGHLTGGGLLLPCACQCGILLRCERNCWVLAPLTRIPVNFDPDSHFQDSETAADRRGSKVLRELRAALLQARHEAADLCSDQGVHDTAHSRDLVADKCKPLSGTPNTNDPPEQLAQDNNVPY